MSTFSKIIGTDKFVGGTELVISANKLKLTANWNLTADNTGPQWLSNLGKAGVPQPVPVVLVQIVYWVYC